MESGYNVQLDRTCYDISYATESDRVNPGTFLFNITIFAEADITGTVFLALPDPQINLGGIGGSGSAHVFFITSSSSVTTYNFSIVTGKSINEPNLLIGSYQVAIRMAFSILAFDNPEFQITPVNLTIYSKQ